MLKVFSYEENNILMRKSKQTNKTNKYKNKKVQEMWIKITATFMRVWSEISS